MNTLFSLYPTWPAKDAASIAKDCALIEESFHRAVYTLNGGQLQPFFSNQQRMVMRRLDQGCEKNVKDCLLAVWDNLYGQFGNYLDHRLPLATPVLSRKRKRNAALFAPLETQLVDDGVSPALIAVLKSTLAFDNLPNGEEVPLAKLAYLRKLVPLLERCVKKPRRDSQQPGARAETLESRLVRLLVLHNFNSFDFYWYCTREIDRQVNSDLPLMEQLDGYQAWPTELAHHPQQTNTAFVAGLHLQYFT